MTCGALKWSSQFLETGRRVWATMVGRHAWETVWGPRSICGISAATHGPGMLNHVLCAGVKAFRIFNAGNNLSVSYIIKYIVLEWNISGLTLKMSFFYNNPWKLQHRRFIGLSLFIFGTRVGIRLKATLQKERNWKNNYRMNLWVFIDQTEDK